MKRNIQIGVIIVMLLLFLSCKKESLLDNALFFAGDNRVELEKVISYYSQKEKDSLKLKAAYFLIENMQYHYYYDGSYIDSMLTYYLTLSKQENIVPQKILDSLLYRSNSFSMQNIEKIYDIHMLDSAFICSNIDFSFKIWEELPWCKNVSFEDFCRYILPYRIGTERPSLWKEYFYSKYYPILHRDIQHLNEPIDAISLLMDSLTKKDFRFTMTAPPNMPNVGPVYAELLCGSCRELTDFSVYVGRSLGIPCAVDFSPMRGDVNDGHLWTVYFSGEDTYVQDFPYGINILQKDKKIKENKLKVYRKQFCVNKLLEQRNVTTEYIFHFLVLLYLMMLLLIMQTIIL